MPRPASFRRDPEVSGPGTGLGPGRPGGPGGPGRSGPGPRRARRRPSGPGRFRRLRARRWFQVVMALLVAFVIWLGWSVGHALTYPGGGTVSERLAEWARDHYLGPVVTFGEWVSYNPPKVGGKPSFALTGPSAGPVSNPKPTGHAKAEPSYPAPAPLTPLVAHPLRGEGKWRVLGTAKGEPAIYGTYMRASSVYTSYVTGIVSMNQNLVRFQLHPGAEDPGPGHWKAQPSVPPGRRLGLLATFNGGFKISTSGGGFYLNGATSGVLTKGVASVVYYRDGRIAIGNWGGSVRMTPDVVGVRQNLHMIVAHGRIPASVDYNVTTTWGATLGGGYYVWRSGIGMTRDGRVIFVYGPSLNVRELAELLKRAGAVTGMELDINPDWMSYMYYLPKHHPAEPTPVNLLPDQVQPPDRYYGLASRDFTAVYAR
ncbi:MAG TPA: phosphodiester glycosidase family protein [Streptosporangiaceae bacterium]